MYTIYQLPEFDAWLSRIKDGMTRRRLGRRLEKAQHGSLGGDKSTQAADIAKAIALAGTLED